MIPDFETLMLPVLELAAQGELTIKKAIEELASKFQLTEMDREQLLPSGTQKTFDNRVTWAKTYLKQAGLVKYPRRGCFIATQSGQDVLKCNPDRIDIQFLKQFESFNDFKSRKGVQTIDNVENESDIQSVDSTPDEIMRAAHKNINAALGAELLDRIREASPQFFEELIVALLLAMGYGGTSEDAARALGQSGDNGVDGVIDQDPLGVDQIYVQAKRYAENNKVGAGDIRDFFGALSLKKAQKGLFFTTSSFSSNAIQTARDLGMRIVLINGEQLTNLMIRYNIGCRDEEILHLKKVDEDFFE